MLKLYPHSAHQPALPLQTPDHPVDTAIAALIERAETLDVAQLQVDLGETFQNRFLLVWHNTPQRFDDLDYLAYWQDVAKIVCNHGERVDDTLHLFPHRRGPAADFWVVGGDGRPATHCANGLMYAGQRWHACWGGRRITFRCGEQTRVVNAVGESARVNLGRPQTLSPRDIKLASLGAPPVLLNTGEPHAVSFYEDLTIARDLFDKAFLRIGRQVCGAWGPAGINWNLINVGLDGLRIRTFERGVRRATNSCGTGSAASFYAAKTTGRWSGAEAPVISAGGCHVVSIHRNDLYVAGRPQHHETLSLGDYLQTVAAS